MKNTALIEKIQNLPPDIASEVEDFVDFLTKKKAKNSFSEIGLTKGEIIEHRNSFSSFAEDWDQPEMEIYDKL